MEYPLKPPGALIVIVGWSLKYATLKLFNPLPRGPTIINLFVICGEYNMYGYISYYLTQKYTLNSPVSATVSLELEITKTVTSVRVCPGVGITFTLLLILNSSPEKITSNLVFFYVVKNYFTHSITIFLNYT